MARELPILMLDDLCPHDRIVPYGDGTMGRCTECGEGTFPMVDEGDPEVPRHGLVMVMMAEHRDELLDRLRERYRRLRERKRRR